MARLSISQRQAVVSSKPRIVGSAFCIRSNYVVRRNIWFSSTDKPKQLHRITDKNLIDNSHTGEMSEQSRKKITSAINWLVACSAPKWVAETKDHKGFYFKNNFITLTLPATDHHITHENINKLLLQPFLDYARKTWQLKNYVWKIELQSNGSPHVHLTTDTYIHHSKLRSYWNSLCSKEGLTQLYTAKYLGCSFEFYLKHNPTTPHSDVAKRWEQWNASTKQGFTSPNTVDVHAIRNVKDLAAYCCKYMAKNLDETIMVKGLSALAQPTSTARMWGCSYMLSRAYKTSVEIYDGESEEGDSSIYQDGFITKQILGNPDKAGIRHSVADVTFIKPHQWHNKVKGKLYRAYHEVRFRIFNAHKASDVVDRMAKEIIVPLS